MKRYEKMEKEEIIEIYCKLDQDLTPCGSCIAKGKCNTNDSSIACTEEVKRCLNEEIEMIPRCYKYKTAEEAKKAFGEFAFGHCCRTDCNECKYTDGDGSTINCHINWLYEEEEE